MKQEQKQWKLNKQTSWNEDSNRKQKPLGAVKDIMSINGQRSFVRQLKYFKNN